MIERKPIDFLLLLTVMLLLGLGTLMVFSSSTPYAYKHFDEESYTLIKKQVKFLIIGLVVMFLFANIHYKKLRKYSHGVFLISIILLIFVAIPKIGSEYHGARRWISILGQSFQPSELAKLSIILIFASNLSRRKENLNNLIKGVFPYLGILGLVVLLLLLQPHFSATVLIVTVSVILLMVAGAKILHFALLSSPVILLGINLIVTSEYRMKRFTSFLNPSIDPQGGSWQLLQSLYAIGSGGLWGRGLGKSLQKFLYIPEPYNDFILSVLAEELGFLGIFIVLVLYIIFIWRGFKISLNAPDKFGLLLALGITSMISLQVIINIAVVSASMPITGMPLPFFSYGGTSLIFLLASVGILLNISRHSKFDKI